MAEDRLGEGVGGRFPGAGAPGQGSARFLDACVQKGPIRDGAAGAFAALAFGPEGAPRGPDAIRAALKGLSDEDLARAELAARYDWRLWARPKQTEPPGAWRWWFLLSGRGFGKALALDTPLPTADGWTTMAEVRVGDCLFDERGEPCAVTSVSPVYLGRRCRRVVFDDGSEIVADVDHEWVVWDGSAPPRPRRMTTAQLGAALCGGGYGLSVVNVVPGQDLLRREVVAVEPVPSVPVRCIGVDSPSHLYLAGRSYLPTHNTRTAAETTNLRAASGRARRIGLVGPTARLVRETMVEGPDGILARSAPWFTPHYEPSKTRLTYPNGAVATTLTADEPDTLRGPSFDWMWLEEIASWRYPEAFWEGAELCLRIGAAQGIITGTPKAIPLIRDLVQGKKGKDGKRCLRDDLVVTRGNTFENSPNLSRGFLEALVSQYEGTNLGRQELYAEILEDIEGALWTYELIEKNRVTDHPALVVLAVAVDPSTSVSGAGDECGIVAGGLGDDGHAYVLADRTTRGTPDHWAREAVKAFHDFRADHLVYEGNFARDVVRTTIATLNPHLPLREVTATRGKAIRAEPVSALYEQGKVHHVGMFPRLEDEMASWYPGAQSPKLERSPNRLDALVWLVTDLMLGDRALAVSPISTGRRSSPWRL